MKCPYCNSKMEKGEINQDRYPLKWKSENRSVKSVKLTSLLTKTYVEAYMCGECNKIIIDINEKLIYNLTMLNEQGDNIIFFYEEYKRMKSRIELLEILAEAENDVNNKRTAPIAETFDDLRQMLQKSKSI